MKKHLLALSAASLLAGCGNDNATPQTQFIPPGTTPVAQNIRLEPFADCASLEQYIEDNKVAEMKEQLRYAIMGATNPQAFGGVPGRATAEDAAAPPMAPANENVANAGGSATGAKSPTPTSHTTTNTQVKGVDEADFVKNDGNRIFVLSGGVLYATTSWPAADLKVAGKLEIEGWPVDMFLDGNRVVVFSSIAGVTIYDKGGLVPPVGPTGMGMSSPGSAGAPTMSALSIAPCPEPVPTADIARPYPGCGWSRPMVKATVIDVSTLSNPKAISQTYLPGSYNTSRRIGGIVRVVLSDYMNDPVGIQYWPQVFNGPSSDKAALTAAFARLEKENEAAIRKQTLADWLPEGEYKNASGQLVKLPYECKDFHHPNAPVHSGVLTVATLDLAKPEAGMKRTSVLGQAGVVYASSDALFVATTHWWPFDTLESEATYIHKFDINMPERASYRGSGFVPGYLNNQFSMDELDGYLRVATTISKIEKPATPTDPNMAVPAIWRAPVTTNRIFVLGHEGMKLSVVGKTEELAEGERIFSARFMGKRGFLVTFRQVDPFFTFDLSDPKNPRKVGELKIPGFSTYLHPLDENHVLAIGTEIDPSMTWMRSAKLSIFDVTDFAKPQEVFKQVVGSFNSSSEAQHDHRAFNYFAERKLLAIPFTDYGAIAPNFWEGFRSDLRIFSVDVKTGFMPRGSLSMSDVYATQGKYMWDYSYTPMVRRSVMASDAGHDFVYAISDAGIRVADLVNLNTPLATALFNK